MSYKLKPCPFCGGEADYDWGSTSDIGGALHQNGWVNCTNSNCDASIDVDSIDDNMSDKDLIAKWNNHIDDRMVEEIAELKSFVTNLSNSPIHAKLGTKGHSGYEEHLSADWKEGAKDLLAKLNQEGEE